jgi:GH15 family glucan-1,4-alpha-glucosidase
MSRSIVLGNGNIYVGLDRFAQVRDLYFPYVGLENQIGGHYKHLVGVWVANQFSWINDGSWDIKIDCEPEALVSIITADNKALGITLIFHDTVYNESNIFLRKISIINGSNQSCEIRLFLGHQFELYKSHSSETAYFDPISHTLIHYKGQRVFLMNGEFEGLPFTDYSTGVFNIEGKEGTHKDAEDGLLEKNPIEHGPVDSVMGFSGFFKDKESKVVHYWMCVAESIEEAKNLNDYVLHKTPEHLLQSTTGYWSAWVNKYNFSFYGLPKEVVSLFKKSLMYVRAHVDAKGSIIASGDSSMMQYGKDTYSYMWPRDAAFTAITLDKAGDPNVAKRFFKFANDVITDDGYFMHKYRPDRSLGSSWHPWIKDGVIQLPIQEDETALVLYALWQHYEHSKDLEFIESHYNSLIKKAAQFLVHFRDPETGLPKPSYDLWEEKYGVSTFTCSTVYGALVAAAKFAELFGKTSEQREYVRAAEDIKFGILKYLYNKESGNFYKMFSYKGKEKIMDATIDISSVYGIYNFGILGVSDPIVVQAVKNTETALLVRTSVGGCSRYQNDRYFKVGEDTPGNPWFITTLWLAQYYILRAENEKALEIVVDKLSWVNTHAMRSGILSEQLNPYTGEPLSAAPLTWSHSEYINTVIMYLDKLEELGICKACNPVL